MFKKVGKKCWLVALIFAALTFIISATVILGNVIPAKAAVTYNTNYDHFENNYIYEYTDYTKGSAGNANDKSQQSVSDSSNHGTKANPFVISTKAQWDYFTGQMTTGTSGSGQYYVLNTDIGDPTSRIALNPIVYFCGTLYGNNHIIWNADINGAKDPYAAGLFCYTGGAYISDLNVVDYNIANGRVHTGGLIGEPRDGTTIANITIKGSITSNITAKPGGSFQISTYYAVGGIAGIANGPFNAYKVATESDLNFTDTTGTFDFVGSFIGISTNGPSNLANLNAYDIYTKAKVETSFAGNPSGYYGLVGHAHNKLNIKDCLNVMDINCLSKPYMVGGMGTLNGLQQGASYDRCYSYLDLHYNGTTYRPAIFAIEKNVTITKATDVGTMSSSSTYYMGSNGYNNSSFAGRTDPTYDTSTFSTFLSLPKNKLNSAIWNIPNIDLLTSSTSAPDVFANPMFKFNTELTFLNRDDTKISDSSITVNPQTFTEADVDAQTTLPSPDAPAKFPSATLAGWTEDKDSDKFVHETFDSYLFGERSLYPVWDMKGITAEITADKTLASGKKFEAEYANGDPLLTLTCNLKYENGTDYTNFDTSKVSYKWFKGTKQVGTGKTLKIKEVTDNAEDYTCKVTGVVDSDNKLIRMSSTEEVTSDKVNVNIKKAKAVITDLKLADGVVPYEGMPTKDLAVTFTAKVGSKTVTGTGVIGTNEHTTVSNGTNDYDFKFTPDATLQANYDSVFAVKAISLTAQPISISYIMDGYAGTPAESLSGSLTIPYGDVLNATAIISDFNSSFAAALAGGKYTEVKEMTPYLSPADQASYTPEKVDKFSKKYENVKETVKIKVTFQDTKLKVTFDPDDGSGNTTEENIKYNNKILRPNDPTKSGYAFAGWYWQDYDGAGGEREWDFDTDTVKGDMTLKAKWTSSTTKLTKLEITDVKGKYTAFDTIADGDIKIVATYTTTVTGSTATTTSTEELKLSDVTVNYGAGETLPVPLTSLRVKQNKITVQIDDVVSDPLALPVAKKKVDLSGLTLSNKTEIKDGTAKQIGSVSGAYPVQLDSATGKTTYKYYLGTLEVLPTDVKELGEYDVVASFTVLPQYVDDYEVGTISAKLTIVAGASSVKVEWDKTVFDYNGKEQAPVPKFIKEDGTEAALGSADYHLEGDTAVKDVGTGYKVKVVIDNTAVYSVSDGAEVTFEIKKALLETPTYTDGSIIYNGGLQKISDFLAGFDGTFMTVTTGGEEKDAGTYTAYIQINAANKNNYGWKDDPTNDTVTVDWKIEKKSVTVVWGDRFFVMKEGATFSPKVANLLTLAPTDASVLTDSAFTFTGDIEKSEAGNYTATVAFAADVEWAKNYTLTKTTVQWAIMPKEGMTLVTVEWIFPEGTTDNTYKYDGNVKKPDYKIFDKDGNDITETEKANIALEGDTAAKWAGEYTLTVKHSDANYFLVGSTVQFKIVLNDEGQGTNPNAPDTPVDPNTPDDPTVKPDNPNGDGDGGIKLPDNFPLWQLIVGGVGLILGSIFLGKGLSTFGKAKKLKKKTAQSATRAYAGVMVNGMLFGISNTWWTVIAISLAAYMVIGFVVMLLANKSLENAEEAYAEEAARADKQRRDEEMKMMFMMMNKQGGGSAPAGGYAASPIDVKEIVTQVVAALLPTMQNTMQQLTAGSGGEYDDAEVKRQLKEHEDKIQELFDKDDGFNDVIEVDDLDDYK